MGSVIDYDRAACLCGAGAPDYFAAVSVNADGTEALWLVSKDHLGADNPDSGDANQPHEQLGPLPQAVRERIRAAGRARCGRPTASGRPCRTQVAQAGDGCRHHGGPRPLRCWSCGQAMEKQVGQWGCYGCGDGGQWTPAEWVVQR